MDEHLQRIKLAELDGYTNIRYGYLAEPTPETDLICVTTHSKYWHGDVVYVNGSIINTVLPCYLTDLERMIRLRKKLLTTDQLKETFVANLCKVVNRGDDITVNTVYAMIDATAEHQAKALLQTLKLWID